MSYVTNYSVEALEEVKKFFKKRSSYLEPGGGLAFGIDVHTLNMTLNFITGEPKPRSAYAV